MTRKPWRRHLKASKRLSCSPNKDRVKWQPTNQSTNNMIISQWNLTFRIEEEMEEGWERRMGEGTGEGEREGGWGFMSVHVCFFVYTEKDPPEHLCKCVCMHTCACARTCTEKDPLEHWRCIPRWGWGKSRAPAVPSLSLHYGQNVTSLFVTAKGKLLPN